MSKSIEEIEGIGPSHGAALRDAGIATVEQLLEEGATRSGRNAIVKSTSIAETKVLKWVNHADLFRISGIAGQFAELLEAAGVDTVKELRNRNAENLAAKMEEVNASKNLTRRCPSATVVSDWIEQAKKLSSKVSY